MTNAKQILPTPESTPSAKQAYDTWHDALPVDDGAPAPWHTMVKQHLPVLDSARVLEIGCGRGGFARWLASRDPLLLVAADFSPAAVARAADFNRGTSTRFSVADITRLPHPDNTFNLVISCETIEHVPDPQGAVSELARVLAPEGLLLLTTPNYANLLGMYRAYRRLRGCPFQEEGQPINNFTYIWRTMHWIRTCGLAPRLVDARGHCLVVPGRSPIPIPFLDGPRPFLQWFARHQLLTATKADSRPPGTERDNRRSTRMRWSQPYDH